MRSDVVAAPRTATASSPPSADSTTKLASSSTATRRSSISSTSKPSRLATPDAVRRTMRTYSSAAGTVSRIVSPVTVVSTWTSTCEPTLPVPPERNGAPETVPGPPGPRMRRSNDRASTPDLHLRITTGGHSPRIATAFRPRGVGRAQSDEWFRRPRPSSTPCRPIRPDLRGARGDRRVERRIGVRAAGRAAAPSDIPAWCST